MHTVTTDHSSPGLRRRGLLFLVFVLALFLLPVLAAMAQAAQPIAGTLVAVDARELPGTRTEIRADIRGDRAEITVVQVFFNPHRQALEACYRFPLFRDAAVQEMRLAIGDGAETALPDAALRMHKTAAGDRAQEFVQRLAELPPGQPIRITLRYRQTVPTFRGVHELVLPLAQGSGAAITPERLSLKVALHGSLPVRSVSSRSHKLKAQPRSPWAWDIALAPGQRIASRDFVLRYELAEAADPEELAL
ncbi:VIT domain-containing protein [Solimonas sp. K1W22B-7]|uniref:VIT domain-containing protein n=1 Tax=Solimonas sp. K1W22B-7 TaxID=2303331 RepID=UPI0013C49050|nr:VIT domain-containing protein [Solimonas sp. K1W22B-7]